jgi:hypothetical protein
MKKVLATGKVKVFDWRAYRCNRLAREGMTDRWDTKGPLLGPFFQIVRLAADTMGGFRQGNKIVSDNCAGGVCDKR